MIPNAIFCATTLCRSRCSAGYPPRGRSRLRRARSASLRSPHHAAFSRRGDVASLLALDFGALLERLGFGNGVHPLAELLLVVQQLGDARLGVLVLGTPEQ